MPLDIISIITAAAKAAAVPPALLLAICHVETGHRNVFSPVDGKRASYGVCQVQLRTARTFSPKAHPSSLLNPEENARYAALYLAYQLHRYDDSWSCAALAYNRGTARFAARESKCNNRYVAKVMAKVKEYQ